MDLLNSIEASAFAEWVRVSRIGYPLMITCHAIGMAVMVGIGLAIDWRVLAGHTDMPISSINRFLGLAWAGFALNLVSGTILFTTQATSYVTDAMFLSKMAFVVGGAVATAKLQTVLAAEAVGPLDAPSPPPRARTIAIVSVVCWIGGLVTGRLIAYL